MLIILWRVGSPQLAVGVPNGLGMHGEAARATGNGSDLPTQSLDLVPRLPPSSGLIVGLVPIADKARLVAEILLPRRPSFLSSMSRAGSG
jgi:hypothetical protein